MADLAKLANLSKRVKAAEPKTHEDQSALTKPLGGSDDSGSHESSTAVAEAPSAPSRPASAPVSSSYSPSAPAGPTNVQVKVDLGPLQDILGRVRDEIRNLKDELVKTREKGIKIDFGDTAAEQMDQALKHLSAVSKAGRELAEKMVTSLPESRWYGDVLNLGREVGESLVAGGGGGGGGGSSALAGDLTTIKEALEMQQTQLTAILSIMQRRGG
ncbi:MAG: hypothetical protein HS108_11825 [Planctomycetes bacterium]|jgi:hypothetical protein|nr:hypothetical protein [Planctomycetota bacterium]MCL4729754.1 hypothetical protein [Planctomycetota bacterium]